MGTTNGNNNGANGLARLGTDAGIETAKQVMQLPPWLQTLRDAMGGAIKGEDLQAVMGKQVEAAKEGDIKAARFVFDQAHKMLQANTQALPPVTIVQNNYYDTPAAERPDAPVVPEDPKEARIRKLRNRVRAGSPLSKDDDRTVRPVSDEEEKELRRREQEREDDEAGDPLRD